MIPSFALVVLLQTSSLFQHLAIEHRHPEIDLFLEHNKKTTQYELDQLLQKFQEDYQAVKASPRPAHHHNGLWPVLARLKYNHTHSFLSKKEDRIFSYARVIYGNDKIEEFLRDVAQLSPILESKLAKIKITDSNPLLKEALLFTSWNENLIFSELEKLSGPSYLKKQINLFRSQENESKAVQVFVDVLRTTKDDHQQILLYSIYLRFAPSLQMPLADSKPSNQNY